VVYSNFDFPCDSPLPVVWQNTLVDPKMRLAAGHDHTAIARESAAKLPLFRASAAVLVASEAERNRICSLDPELAGSVFAVPFYMPDLHPAESQRLSRHRAESVRIIFIGNDARRKGLPRLIKAVQGLPDRARSRVDVVVISNFTDGPVPLPEQWRVVRGAGRRDVIRELDDSHVLANPATFESYGFVYVEAMARGVVPIVPAWEVQREIVGDELARFAVGSMTELRRSLEVLVRDDELRLSLAEIGRNRFMGRFAPEVVGPRLVDLFRNAARTSSSYDREER
jgi:glycosyltransferase involved in cell wall biosynthesis